MKKKQRSFWISLVLVGLLAFGSVALFLTGTRPILGLDLEGGVSVILSAPEGTPDTVMTQALENIRNRIDAFGTAEPLLFVTGNTIEVQIPGLARGTIEERPKQQSCIADDEGNVFTCFDTQEAADAELGAAGVRPVVSSVCLTDDPTNAATPTLFGEDAPCAGSEKDATTALDAIAVKKQQGEFCLTGTGLATDPCYPTRDEADQALSSIQTVTSQSFCIQNQDKETLTSDLGAACAPSQEEAQALLDGMTVRNSDTQFCVVSSAGENLGCFLDRESAEARLQETGQERLLQVIGETARLEQREVLGVLAPTDPTYASTPLTCGTVAEQATKECSFEALKDQNVVFKARDDETKYQLGPVEITGDAIDKATAQYNAGSSTSVGQGWQIQFDLTNEGSGTFSDVTTRLEGKQLAIVVDDQVISAPTVQSPITNGTGVITGSFTERRAKDLATQLNAGALPVELTTQQVLTVSPTLGDESLQQGLVAAIAGLVLLAAYLLFYYRILAVVAWVGMMIWAILALGLVALAGRTIGYNLTLAGVAGLVISLGVTADSYIVFFERLKDEVHAGRSPRAAVAPAFKRSFRTIVAADLVTAIAAAVLYVTAISSVRGFALTLGVATLLDLFVVYFFKRPAVSLLTRNERIVNWRVMGIKAGLAADREVGPPDVVPAIAGGSE
ncbi:MAG TPA: protein translocase subunit SecD [Actinomycetota bacterium]|nr:protein translocase subunit SecD [Actinomycetota bacterium]